MTLCVIVQYGWLHLHVDRDWCSYLILCMYVSVLQGLLELLLDSFGSLFESTSGRSISKCMGSLIADSTQSHILSICTNLDHCHSYPQLVVGFCAT